MAFPWLAKGESPPNKGKKASIEARTRMSISRKKLMATGWRPSNWGKKMNYSEEHLEKLRQNIRKALAAIKPAVPIWIHKGYKYLHIPGTARTSNLEHRLIAQKVLGRKLKKNEVVHHINGDKSDNRNSNLLICENWYNRWLHERMAEIFQIAMFRKEKLN